MQTELRRFLEFNGRKVYFLAADGQWWIALKPICDALGINWNRQFQNLKADPILGAAFANQQMQEAGQGRRMVCLPEFFVYGGLFKLKSGSKGFAAYQWKCYELLYRYFHGSITSRRELLMERTLARAEMMKARQELTLNATYRRMTELQGKALHASKALKKLDEDLVTSDLGLMALHN